MQFFLLATASALAMLFIFWMIFNKDDFLGEELRKSPFNGEDNA